MLANDAKARTFIAVRRFISLEVLRLPGSDRRIINPKCRLAANRLRLARRQFLAILRKPLKILMKREFGLKTVATVERPCESLWFSRPPTLATGRGGGERDYLRALRRQFPR